MKDTFFHRHPQYIKYGMAFLILLPGVLFSCTSHEPSRSKGALAFNKEIRKTIKILAPLLIKPVAQGDVSAIDALLDKTCREAQKAGQPLTCGIVILDKNGVSLTGRYPKESYKALNYSHYSAVAQALEKRKAIQARLFLQDGTKFYVVLSPLILNGHMEGLLGIGYTVEEASKRWGITEKEFLSLDFSN